MKDLYEHRVRRAWILTLKHSTAPRGYPVPGTRWQASDHIGLQADSVAPPFVGGRGIPEGAIEDCGSIAVASGEPGMMDSVGR